MQILLLLAAYMACFVAADFTLSQLQPIADFSFSCTEAYNIEIQNCDNTVFAPFDGEANCSQACLNELNTLASTLQRACQADGVKPNTVIAHAFQGDLANWLCAQGTYSTQVPTVASGTATNAKATTFTAAASTSTSSSSAAASSSSESSSSSTSSQSSESSISTTFSTTTTTSVMSTPAPSPSSTTSSKPKQTSHTIGDSTPFDQTVYNDFAMSKKIDKTTWLLVQILVPTVTSLLVFGIGGWMY